MSENLSSGSAQLSTEISVENIFLILYLLQINKINKLETVKL